MALSDFLRRPPPGAVDEMGLPAGRDVPMTTGGPQVSGIQEYLAMLAKQGVPPTAQNMNRAREATARNARDGVGRSAPSGGSVAHDIEGGGGGSGGTRPQVSSDTAVSGPQAPPRSQAPSDSASARSPQLPPGERTATDTPNSSAQPTSGSDYDPASLIGLLPSAAGIGAAALASRYGGGGGSGGEFVGNSAGVPTGRMMDIVPDPVLAGPRAPQLGAPPPPAMNAEVSPLQTALARAIEPAGMPSGMPTSVGGPSAQAPQLPAPGPRAPIAMPDQTSGPTIARPDQRPLPPSAGVTPGETLPTTVNRTAAPGANPNAIVNPGAGQDPSRFRAIIEAIMGAQRGGGARGAPRVRGF